MDTQSREIRSMFSDIATRYDLLNRMLSFFQDMKWRKRAAREIVQWIGQNARILDTCTGTADLAIELARNGEKSHVVGTDFSIPMLTVGQQKRDKLHQNNLSFIGADALSLPFRECSFHAVTVAFGFRNLQNRQRGLDEMLRVLQPGGTVLILEFSMPQNPLFRALFRLYLKCGIPLIGLIMSGTKAYHYLSTSIADFPPREEIKNILEKGGLTGVECFSQSFGIVTFYTGKKK